MRSWLCALLLVLAAPLASAQSFPSRPVQMVVTFAAGGSVDVIARTIAEDLAKRLGQPVIVENRVGANGNIAAAFVAKAPADGHTLLVTGGSTLTLNPYLYKELPFDPLQSFAPVVMTARTNLILVVQPKLKVNTVAELIALAKAHPGELNYGSGGTGSQLHIAGELFNAAAGIDTRHVPYKGALPALTDLLSGQIDFMFDSATSVPHIRSGKLKALGVVGPNPVPALPDVKVLGDLGVKGMDAASGWHGIFAPAGTPPETVRQLNGEIVRILQTPRLRERIVALGAEPAFSTPDELRNLVALDLERLGNVLKKMGVHPE